MTYEKGQQFSTLVEYLLAYDRLNERSKMGDDKNIVYAKKKIKAELDYAYQKFIA